MLRELLMRGLQYLDQTTAEIRARFSFRTLEPDQRRKVQGRWFKNGVQIARRAAHYRDLYDRHIPEVPYTGEQIREKAARVASAEEVWRQLDLLARQARDTYLIERAELHAMSMGVLKALEARAAYPFLQEGDRQMILPGIHELRAELDQRNRKISKTKRAAKKAAAEIESAKEAARAMPLEELEKRVAQAAGTDEVGPANEVGPVQSPGAAALPVQRGAWAPGAGQRPARPAGALGTGAGPRQRAKAGSRAGAAGRDRLVGRGAGRGHPVGRRALSDGG
jgi:hypothetical protein